MHTQTVRLNSFITSTFVFLTTLFIVGCGSQPSYKSLAIPQSFYSQQCYITQNESYIWLEQKDEWLTLPENSRRQLEHAEVNWLEENILIVSLGQKPSAGFDITLTSWLMEQNHWQVVRQVKSPKEGSLQATMITSPCVLVKIPKTIKSFTLKSEGGVTLGRWIN